MYITRVELKNIKCFEALVWEHPEKMPKACEDSMKRQREHLPRLNQLFALAPAALDV